MDSLALTLGSLLLDRAGIEGDSHDLPMSTARPAYAQNASASISESDTLAQSNDARMAELVQRVRHGDAEAFDTLVIAQLNALVGFAHSLLLSRDAAEDAVQDVLARIWQGRDRLPTQGSFRAYLFAAVRHRALDMHKHDRVRRRAAEAFRREPAGILLASTPDVGLPETAGDVTQARLARLRQTLTTLPERQRTALALRYERQLRVAEVAAVLGVSVKAAEQLLVRAIRTLRKAIA